MVYGRRQSVSCIMIQGHHQDDHVEFCLPLEVVMSASVVVETRKTLFVQDEVL